MRDLKPSVKIAIILIAVILIANFCSCTRNQLAKQWGGTQEIDVPSGLKVMGVQWKNDGDETRDNLWLFCDTMESDYQPHDKYFIEKSAWGVLNGKVIIHEKR